jgi:hypothetical protein
MKLDKPVEGSIDGNDCSFLSVGINKKGNGFTVVTDSYAMLIPMYDRNTASISASTDALKITDDHKEEYLVRIKDEAILRVIVEEASDFGYTITEAQPSPQIQ